MKDSIPSKFLPAFVWISFLLWAVALWLGQTTLTANQFRSFSTYAAIAPFLALAFEQWIWRVRPLGFGLVKIPVLIGTWKGQVIPTWKNPTTGQVVAPVEAFLVVHQTFSTIQVRLLTDQSSSALLSGTIRMDDGEPPLLLGVYRNTPGLKFRENSPIHFGAVSITIEGDGKFAKCLRGHYWTDRDTKGELVFESRDTNLNADSFKAAQIGIFK